VGPLAQQLEARAAAGAAGDVGAYVRLVASRLATVKRKLQAQEAARAAKKSKGAAPKQAGARSSARLQPAAEPKARLRSRK
jgi:hypothetical protein